jgi:endonuclease G
MPKRRKKNSLAKNQPLGISFLLLVAYASLLLVLASLSVQEWRQHKNQVSGAEADVYAPHPENEPGPAIPPPNEGKPVPPETDMPNLSMLLPAKLPGELSVQLIDHDYYKLAYLESHEQAAWVAYSLTREKLGGTHRRKDQFQEDHRVTTRSAHPDDYRFSGYDRGHLAPAADFTFSEQAMEKSFYMSNISPQVPGFNRGIWQKLEQQVRTWAREYEQLLVVTGPVFTQKIPTSIGENNVIVPDYFYKVLFDIQPPSYKMLAFLLKNEKSSRPLLDYVLSVDSLEQFSGIDFFFHLPDSIEYELEKQVIYEDWFE